MDKLNEWLQKVWCRALAEIPAEDVKYVVDAVVQSFESKIRNLAFFLRSRAMFWGFLKGCFPNDAIPSDVDGTISINGYILVFERKDERLLEKGKMARGQRILMEAFLATGAFTVFTLYADRDGRPVQVHIEEYGDTTATVKHCDRDGFKLLCKQWSDRTQSRKAYQRYDRP